MTAIPIYSAAARWLAPDGRVVLEDRRISFRRITGGRTPILGGRYELVVEPAASPSIRLSCEADEPGPVWLGGKGFLSPRPGHLLTAREAIDAALAGKDGLAVEGVSLG